MKDFSPTIRSEVSLAGCDTEALVIASQHFAELELDAQPIRDRTATQIEADKADWQAIGKQMQALYQTLCDGQTAEALTILKAIEGVLAKHSVLVPPPTVSIAEVATEELPETPEPVLLTPEATPEAVATAQDAILVNPAINEVIPQREEETLAPTAIIAEEQAPLIAEPTSPKITYETPVFTVLPIETSNESESPTPSTVLPSETPTPEVPLPTATPDVETPIEETLPNVQSPEPILPDTDDAMTATQCPTSDCPCSDHALPFVSEEVPHGEC